MLYYHSGKFNGHRHCGSGDVMVLDCQLILQDHMIKELYGIIHALLKRNS